MHVDDDVHPALKGLMCDPQSPTAKSIVRAANGDRVGLGVLGGLAGELTSITAAKRPKAAPNEKALPLVEIEGDVLGIIAGKLSILSAEPSLLTRVFHRVRSRQAEAFQWAQTRAVCVAFRDAIDEAARQAFDRPEIHFSVNGAKHAKRAKPGFLAFAFMRTRTCVLCRQYFSGCVSEIGVYAHQACILSQSLATIYLQRPITARAQARMAETNRRLLPAVRASDPHAFDDLATLELSGYNRGHGQYDYDIALVGPVVPMLARERTILGAACKTDSRIFELVNTYEVECVVDRLVSVLESQERKLKADDLDARRRAKADRRQQRFHAAIADGKLSLPGGAASFSEWRSAIMALPGVGEPTSLDSTIRSFFTPLTLSAPKLEDAHAALVAYDSTARATSTAFLERIEAEKRK